MTENKNILKEPPREAREEERTDKLTIRGITPTYGVKWFDNQNANVVDIDLELSNGNIIKQRETFSFAPKSNLGKLVRVVLGIPENESLHEINIDEVLGKTVLGDITHWKTKRGDIFEKVKNFRALDDDTIKNALHDIMS